MHEGGVMDSILDDVYVKDESRSRKYHVFHYVAFDRDLFRSVLILGLIDR